MGQDEQRHHQIDADHHDERQESQSDVRSARAFLAMPDLVGIEGAGGRGAFAHDRVFRRLIRRSRQRVVAKTFAIRAGPGLSPGEPPQAESQHDRGSDEAQSRRRERRGAEERHGDGVLDRRSARQRRHGEGGGAKHDRRRHQPTRNARRAKQSVGHRRDDEKGHEQADAAIGDEGAGEDHRQHRPFGAELFGHELGDGRNRRTEPRAKRSERTA